MVRSSAPLALIVALALHLPVAADDASEENRRRTPAEDSPQQQELEHPPPTAGALPTDDPTMLPAEEDELPIGEPDEAETESASESEEDDRNVRVAYDGALVVSVDDWFTLTLAGLLQARYTVNYRTDPPTDPFTLEREKQVAQGFDVARARFDLGIGLTEFVALFMRIGVAAGGDFSFQKAFLDLKWKYFRIRSGLFMQPTIVEGFLGPTQLYFLDYSIVENVFSPGSSAGVMFTYLRKRFSINAGASNGLRTGFSEIRDPANADFAFTVRTEYAWGEAGLTGFNSLISRRGTPFAVRLGGALHYQDGGRTQGSLPAKIAIGTVDVSLRGNGWSVLFAAAVGQDATDATPSNEAGELVSSGVTLVGGYFVTEDIHVFGRYAAVPKPKIQGALPPAAPDEIIGPPSTFQSFGVGFSYFFLPGSNNVKLSSDFNYFLGREAGSLVPVSPLNSIQPNDAGSQFAWRLQVSGRF